MTPATTVEPYQVASVNDTTGENAWSGHFKTRSAAYDYLRGEAMKLGPAWRFQIVFYDNHQRLDASTWIRISPPTDHQAEKVADYLQDIREASHAREDLTR